MSTKPRMLTLEGLDVRAMRDGGELGLVRSVSLSINRGEVLALVGGSGSGKSMTCAGAQDVLPPGVYRRAGRVCIDGVEIAPSALRGRLVTTILQNPRSAFNPLRTIFDHAREVRLRRRKGTRQRPRRSQQSPVGRGYRRARAGKRTLSV